MFADILKRVNAAFLLTGATLIYKYTRQQLMMGLPVIGGL